MFSDHAEYLVWQAEPLNGRAKTKTGLEKVAPRGVLGTEAIHGVL
jgi:hypothetical protein